MLIFFEKRAKSKMPSIQSKRYMRRSIALSILLTTPTTAFQPTTPLYNHRQQKETIKEHHSIPRNANTNAVSRCTPISTTLNASGRFVNHSSTRSKRQERVGQLVRAELAAIIQRGFIKNADYLSSDVRNLISIINADVSPDLRQARITVSIMGDDVVDKRRAYSWLVKSSNFLKFELAQKMSHMKGVPSLTFVQADVGAAVDVMALIDKISEEGYKRERIGFYGGDDDSIPTGLHMGIDFDEDEEDDGWLDDDDWDD
mmetsp:Transcript_65602/g.77688  ORF Transcript_65602/g.77688 Transcript_65602/m.77688 type:complete len:258 (+) Transcript_65602:33-806(+)